MAMREYVGARYVPVFADPIQWDITLKYEPLTVVTDNGASYVSRRYVPEGIQLNDTDYWILWADYNAQLQQLIEDVNTYNGRIEDLEEALPVTSYDDVNTVEAAISAIDTRTDALEDALPIADYDDVNTVSAGISALDTRIDALEDALPIAEFDDVNTVDARFDTAENNIANLQTSLAGKVSMGAGMNADLRLMGEATQLFGLQAVGSNNHSVVLIICSNGIAAYDYDAQVVLWDHTS